ncbi:MAG: hypothetical protein JWN45_1903 [Acidobacteriaceae bacterium]|nr:hypothetical protein [Acidobacteriaceae bacterium]
MNRSITTQSTNNRSRRRFLKNSLAVAAGLSLAPHNLFSRKDKNLDVDALLIEIERRACRYFYEQADPLTGLVKDRARHSELDKHTVSSIAATGFGLSAMCIAHQNRFLSKSDAKKRVQNTLEYIARRLPHQNGFFFHFVDMHSGDRAWKCELSSIDTTLLLCGVLHARSYFDSPEIRQLATDIYERVDWKWMLNGGDMLSHGWKPETGFLKSRWDVYCELMMIYLLAIGSPSHPIPPASWDAWQRPRFEYGDLKYIGSNAPLFVHQYSHAWIDFRAKRDKYADYFENSRIATLAHQRFCISLHNEYPWMSDDLWGITASDSEHGYVVWGGPPKMGNIDGTIVPCAAAGSLPFQPDACKRVLQTIHTQYPRAWTPYGFVDAFHPKHKWYDPEVLGIDLGTTLLMVENLRTGSIWESFMRNREIVTAMKSVGFTNSEGATTVSSGD